MEINDQYYAEDIKKLFGFANEWRNDAKKVGLRFSHVASETIFAKLKSGRPYIFAQAWRESLTPGNEIIYKYYIDLIKNEFQKKSDPILYLSIYFGSADLLIGKAEEFNICLTQRIMANEDDIRFGMEGLKFIIPKDIPGQVYFGKSILWEGLFHGKPTLLDECFFPVEVAQK